MNHKKRNKMLGFLLSGILLFQAGYTTNTWANEKNSNLEMETLELYAEGSFPSVTTETNAIVKDSSEQQGASIYSYSIPAQQAIYDGLNNCQQSIDVSAYHLDRETLRTYMQDILNTSPELFYVEGAYNYYMSNGNITTVEPSYKVSGSTLVSQKAEFAREMNHILDKVDTAWSDLEKILFLHDYIAQNYEYDNAYQIYDAYQFFTQKKGVCQAYTLVYCGLLQRVGIDVSVASSNSMNHIWNVVKLNGKWYHIDITWDDPTNNDMFGLAQHNHLLLSDHGMQEREHYDWVTNYTCSDTTYDDYFWVGVSSPFKYLNGLWYYAAYDYSIDQGKLCSYNFQTAQREEIYPFENWGDYSSGGYYTGCYTGLDVFNQHLYFNTATEVYSYSPVKKTIEQVIQPNMSGYIYGIRINDSNLYFSIAPSPNVLGKLYYYKLPELSVSDYAPVDVNMDELLNLVDVQIVLRAALNIAPLSGASKTLADVNGDSKVNIIDARMVLKQVLGVN